MVEQSKHKRSVLEMIVIDESSVEPMYFQIKEQIRKQIVDGALVVGDALPSDTELSQHLGVSRMTVRQAMQELVNSGVAVRQRGKGTFVTTPKVTQRLLQITSFTRSMVELGFEPSSAVLEVQRVRAPKDVAKILGMGADQKVVKLRRLRFIDGTPLSLQTSYLPLPAALGILAHREELAKRSLYELLEEHCGLSPRKTAESLEIRRVSQEDAELLNVRAEDPVFFVEAIVTDWEGKPIEFVRAQYRGDMFKFHIETVVQE